MLANTNARRAIAAALPIATALLTAVIAPAADANPFANQPKADEVFYHIMPIAWREGIPDTFRYGDLVGMREGLPYLEDLGVTAIWMNPIFPSPAYHGYQHDRADLINPWFGDESDLIDLNLAAHALGIEIYLDFVVYGINWESMWFQDANENPQSQYDDWLAFDDPTNTAFFGYVFQTWTGDSVGFVNWDHRNPLVTDMVTSWAEKWLDPNEDGDFSDGVDGYRLDHVWVQYGFGPDGWGYNIDDFWATWHDRLRALNPNVFTFAEQHDWGSHGGEYLEQFDAAMTKPFEFAARDALYNENAAPLYGQMEATINAMRPDEGTFVGIIGDHDVDRLASAIGADTPATERRAEAAAAVLMLQPFPPIIYYGDEIGMLGRKANYGSDADDIPMREPFKWRALERLPMSRYHRQNDLARTNQYSSNFDGRSVEEQQDGGLLQVYKGLIDLRRSSPALRRGHYHPIAANDSAVWAFMRSYHAGEAPIPDDGQTVVAVVNLSGANIQTTLDLSPYFPGGALPASRIATDPAPLADVTDANASAYPVSVPAYGYTVVEIDLQRPPEPPLRIDGSLDAPYVEVATSSGGSIWAALDGTTLYVATQPASDGRDRFMMVAREPGALGATVWAKSGQLAAPDAYIGNEVDNGWSGWFDAVAPGGPVSGTYLEGSIDLGAQFAPTDTVYLAALSYFTGDGDPLDSQLQVPAGNGDGDVTADEYVEVALADLVIDACEPDLAEPFGVLDIGDVVAFLQAFSIGDGRVDFAAPMGVFDIADVIEFLQRFGAGCP